MKSLGYYFVLQTLSTMWTSINVWKYSVNQGKTFPRLFSSMNPTTCWNFQVILFYMCAFNYLVLQQLSTSSTLELKKKSLSTIIPKQTIHLNRSVPIKFKLRTLRSSLISSEETPLSICFLLFWGSQIILWVTVKSFRKFITSLRFSFEVCTFYFLFMDYFWYSWMVSLIRPIVYHRASIIIIL